MRSDAAPTAAPALGPRSESGLGLAYMAGGMFLFSAVDTQAKFLTETLHPLQIVWSRQAGLLVGVLLLLAWRGAALLRTRHLGLQVARGALAATSAALFIAAVSFVPLADAVAVAFVAPFFVTLLGAAVLREPVGPRRWIAVFIGFIGALIVIRPGFGALHPAVALVVLAAALFALRQILSRMLGAADPTETTVAYTAIVGSAMLTPALPFVWRAPVFGLETALLVSLALMAAAAEILVIKALEVAQAVVVAPVQYSMLLWGVIYGYVVFGDLPDEWTWVGAAIIVATGWYTIHRERLAERRRAAP